MNEYMKEYIRTWLTTFENERLEEVGRYRRPITQEEFEQFLNDCMIEAQETILG